MKNSKIMQQRVKELRKIERANGGVLQPEKVVEHAANPDSALHSAFEWDDSEAAQKYRLEQARQLIRVCVEYVPHVKGEMKSFVSIRSERYEDGGYRHAPTLMMSQDGRDSLLETALWELETFQRKYSELTELAEVFAAIKAVKKAGRKVA